MLFKRKTMKKLPLFMGLLFSFSACSNPVCNSSENASSEEVASSSYSGTSMVWIYESYMDNDFGRPKKVRGDTCFENTNGEPIIGDAEGLEILKSMLFPMAVSPEDGHYNAIHLFYYDLNCTQEVGWNDISTKDVSIFYYVE